MAFSEEELLRELARRRGLSPDADQPPARTPASGTPPGEIDAATVVERPTPTPGALVRAAGRGVTFGLAEPVAAAVTALPLSFGSGRGLREVYGELREDIERQRQEDVAADPLTIKMVETAGTATALPVALQRTLARGAGRVLGRGGTRAGAARGAATKAGKAKPRVRVTAAGEQVPAEGRLAALLKDASVGGATGIAGGDELDDAPEGALRGLMAGSIGNLMLNSAGGRWVLARAMGRLTGSEKVKQATFMGMHPSTKRALRRALAGIGGYGGAED